MGIDYMQLTTLWGSTFQCDCWKLRYGHLETLIDPGGRRIGSEDHQGDQDQTEQNG